MGYKMNKLAILLMLVHVLWSRPLIYVVWIQGKQEFRRTNFGSRLLAAEGEGGGGQWGWGDRGQVWVRARSVPEVKQYPSGSG